MATPPPPSLPSEAQQASTNGGGAEGEKRTIEPIRLPTPEEIKGQEIWNNCAVRSVVSGIMGGGLGLFMGLFLGALDNPLMQEEMTARQQFVYTAKQMGRRSLNSAKTFAVMGVIFSAAECIVEKARAKHDTTNTVVAGCVTGGALSAKGLFFEPTIRSTLTRGDVTLRMWSKGRMCWLCRFCCFFCPD